MQVEQTTSNGDNEQQAASGDTISPSAMPITEVPDAIKERARAICAEFELSHKDMAPSVALKRKQFKEKLQERLWVAACWRDYQLASVQKAFDAEMEAIEREFETEKTNLKEKLLNELLGQKKRLLEGRDLAEEDGFGGSQGGAVSKAQRKLRAKRTGESGEAGGTRTGPSGGKRRQLQSGIDDTTLSVCNRPPSNLSLGLPLGISTGLGEGELHDDLVLILRDEFGNGTGLSRRTRNAGPSKPQQQLAEGAGEEEVDISVEGDTLKIIDKGDFVRGDSIIVQTPDSSELLGTISNVGNREVWIKIDDGARLKITLSQLQSGRYTISAAEDISDATSTSSS